MGWWSDTWKEITSGGRAVTETYNSRQSSNNNANPYAGMQEVGIMNLGGSPVPAPPANPGNPAIVINNADGSRTLAGSLLGGAPSMATNPDGSLYQPTNNPVNMANTSGLNRFINSGGTDDSGFVNATINPDGSTTYTNNAGVTIAAPVGGFETYAGDGNYTTSGGSTLTGSSSGGGGGGGGGSGGGGGGGGATPVVPPVNQALLDALALRDAALAKQLALLNEQFSFATDDYYNQLGTDYREGGLSEAFTTAYDDAVRGIYDVYKSAGMLAQSDVDDDLGILAGAESGEEGRIDSIVDQYMGANRNFVTGGKSDLTSELQGLAVDSEDIPTINAQTAAINAFDVVGRSQPYKEPTEAEVVDFFTDFVKRSYDPSYNVDPTAVATGAPMRVTGSVNQTGANTAPSTIAGLFDPVTGGSVRVVT